VIVILRVVQFHKTGGLEVLMVGEVGLPPPGLNEVQIRIHASGMGSKLRPCPDAGWNARTNGKGPAQALIRVNALPVGSDADLWLVDARSGFMNG
jgi:hypothetical protein